MRLKHFFIAVITSAFCGLTLSLAISSVGLYAFGVPETLNGTESFDLLSEPDRAAVLSDGLSLTDEDTTALRMKYSVDSAFFQAWLMEFQFGDHLPRTTRFVTALGFPRRALLLEAPWPAERLFRSTLSLPYYTQRLAQVQSRVSVRVRWDGVLANAVLFGLPIWCLWIARSRGASSSFAFLPLALTGGMLMTVLAAWSAGFVKISERSERYIDPNAYSAAGGSIETPIAGDWDTFSGQRTRGWTHTRERWTFGRRSADGVSVTPVLWWSFEGCGFPFTSFTNESSTAQRGLGFCCLCEAASPFDASRLKLAWSGFLASVLCWFVVIAAGTKLPAAIRRSIRTRRGECRACGYPLAGLARCPECGAEAGVRSA